MKKKKNNIKPNIGSDGINSLILEVSSTEAADEEMEFLERVFLSISVELPYLVKDCMKRSLRTCFLKGALWYNEGHWEKMRKEIEG